ncbi:MAG TPA: hypothetical protein VF799_11615 [Geobacteraceae bacterium]
MKKQFCNSWRGWFSILLTGLALLALNGIANAEGTGEAFVPSLLSPSAQENQTALNRRLLTARKDLESFRSFAAHFRAGNDQKSLAQLQNPIDDYLKKHVDNLLAQEADNSTLESARLAAELFYAKGRLLISMNRPDSARNAIAEMKKRFSSYQKILVEISGKSTTLDEGIRLLNEELSKAATKEIKKEGT